MDPGQFEQRVARVFEKQGYGYVGLMSLPAEDLAGAYARMATGDLTFSDAVGQLLEKYRSLRDQA
jgi:hypothetical protein